MSGSQRKNNSPWLAHLERSRPVQSAIPPTEADVLIIGAGIAGVATAYFTLTQTRHSVTLVDAGRVAHAATGHNAGQLVSYFERPFPDIIQEFGEELAIAGQLEVNNAWDLIAKISANLNLKTPSWQFLGTAGLPNLATLLAHLEVADIFARHGVPREEILVSEDFKSHHLIPPHYRKYYQVIPSDQLLALLQVSSSGHIGALRGRKGCMNSAAFTEEIVTVLLDRYKDRLKVLEDLPVNTLYIRPSGVVAVTDQGNLRAGSAVLCTNGFEKITLKNETGPEIDTKFHHLVLGSVGYMAGYIQTPATPPTAVSYLVDGDQADSTATLEAAPYIYMTRRPFGEDQAQSLLCIGGPEALYDDTNNYTIDHEYPAFAATELRRFVEDDYATEDEVSLGLAYEWHGLMGYTPNGIRLVGREPDASALYYNLGCNGVGILPSVAGGLRIARLLNCEPLPPSIFDPRTSKGNG
jgi:glycine/D-amino acid oxidase-like deaminating enzyme